MTHPLSIPNGSFDLGNGKISHGDEVIYIKTNQKAVVDEVLQDGDCFITLDDGSFKTVKWREVTKNGL